MNEQIFLYDLKCSGKPSASRIHFSKLRDTELVVCKEPGSDRVKEKNVGLQVGGSGVQSQLTTYLCPPDWGSFYSLALWEIWNRIFLRNLEPSQFVIYDFISSGGREKRGSGKGRRETRLGRISTERETVYTYTKHSVTSAFPQGKAWVLKQDSVLYQKEALKSDKPRCKSCLYSKFAMWPWASCSACLSVRATIHVDQGY